MKQLLLCAALLATTSCSHFKGVTAKDVGRTIADAARIACEIFAEQRPEDELTGLNAKAWCGVQANLQPFIEDLLRVNREMVSAHPGLSRGADSEQ